MLCTLKIKGSSNWYNWYKEILNRTKVLLLLSDLRGTPPCYIDNSDNDGMRRLNGAGNAFLSVLIIDNNKLYFDLIVF